MHPVLILAGRIWGEKSQSKAIDLLDLVLSKSPLFDLTSCPGISPSLQGILVWMTNNAAIIHSDGVTVNKPVDKVIKYRLAGSNCKGEKTVVQDRFWLCKLGE